MLKRVLERGGRSENAMKTLKGRMGVAKSRGWCLFD